MDASLKSLVPNPVGELPDTLHPAVFPIPLEHFIVRNDLAQHVGFPRARSPIRFVGEHEGVPLTGLLRWHAKQVNNPTRDDLQDTEQRPPEEAILLGRVHCPRGVRFDEAGGTVDEGDGVPIVR